MLPGPLVLGAMGPLHSVHTDARRRDDAQREHEQTKDPGGHELSVPTIMIRP